MSIGVFEMKYADKTYSDEQVRLDGNEYLNCKFKRVELIFSAIAPVGLIGCDFDGCRWVFNGPAQQTLEFMSAMHNGNADGGRELIEKTFDNIRMGGAHAGTDSSLSFPYKPTIFIGHGRSKDYLELSDFLRNRGYGVESFESTSRVGMTIMEAVEAMAERASMAFLVHTAEDEQEGGEVRARQNVVHETGIFQGRLGFRRAIVVREEGCEAFSNLDGVQEIRYAPGNISKEFLQVLGVIEREFPQARN